MKRNLSLFYIYTVSLLCLPLAFTSCVEEGIYGNNYVLTFNPSLAPGTNEVSLPATEAKQTVKLSCNTSWTASSGASWLTVTPSSGRGPATLTLAATLNTTTTQRTATVTVVLADDEALSRTIAVTQDAIDEPQYEEIDGHAYVDLGLPSGLLWATMNVGASSPEDYGDYFAWGETEAKDDFSWSTYKWCNGSYTSLTKYNFDSSYGTVDNKTVLDLSDDAAQANWGGSWRMASKDEWQEIKDNCTWTWTTQDVHNGYKVTSKSNGNSIFLPAAGFRHDTSLDDTGSYGYYCSSSLSESDPFRAVNLYFGSGGVGSGNIYRYCGQSVRPVLQPNAHFEVSRESVAFSSTGGTEGVTLTTNLPWTASVSDSWITVSPTSGTGDTDIAITAEANTSTSARTGSVTFTAGGTSLVVAVTQDAAEPQYEEIDGHAYVDLGLPSGLLWATMNVGASSPEDYGDYFAWGETDAKDDFSWSTYKWCNGSSESLTKYNTKSSYGTVDNRTVLDLSDDAAHANWSGSWRMPTEEEWQELSNYCTWTLTSQGGHNGYKVTSKSNDNSLFLPLAGFYDATLYNVNSSCYYWSSSLVESVPYLACAVLLDVELGVDVGRSGARCDGRVVRPVCQPNAYFEVSRESVAFSSTGGTEGATLTTNLPWTASVSDSWITVSPASSTGDTDIAITAEANTSTSARTGSVTFTAGGFSLVVAVTQDAAAEPQNE